MSKRKNPTPTQPLKIGKSTINIKSVKFLKALFWVLSNPMKLKIIRTIYKAGSDGILVKNIQKEIGLNQSHTSIHLRQLRNTNLVERARHGVFVTYKISADTFKSIEDVIEFANKKGLGPQ